MPALALPWWGWTLLTGGSFLAGGVVFTEFEKKALAVALAGVAVYAYTKAK